MKKRTKEDVTIVAPHPPPPQEEGFGGAGPVPPPPPPAPPMEASEEQPAGVIPPPPPMSYGMHDMTMPQEMVPTRPAPNPILPVPKQYQANTDKGNARPKLYKMSSAGASWVINRFTTGQRTIIASLLEIWGTSATMICSLKHSSTINRFRKRK